MDRLNILKVNIIHPNRLTSR